MKPERVQERTKRVQKWPKRVQEHQKGPKRTKTETCERWNGKRALTLGITLDLFGKRKRKEKRKGMRRANNNPALHTTRMQ